MERLEKLSAERERQMLAALYFSFDTLLDAQEGKDFVKNVVTDGTNTFRSGWGSSIYSLVSLPGGAPVLVRAGWGDFCPESFNRIQVLRGFDHELYVIPKGMDFYSTDKNILNLINNDPAGYLKENSLIIAKSGSVYAPSLYNIEPEPYKLLITDLRNSIIKNNTSAEKFSSFLSLLPDCMSKLEDFMREVENPSFFPCTPDVKYAQSVKHEWDILRGMTSMKNLPSPEGMFEILMLKNSFDFVSNSFK